MRCRSCGTVWPDDGQPCDTPKCRVKAAMAVSAETVIDTVGAVILEGLASLLAPPPPTPRKRRRPRDGT